MPEDTPAPPGTGPGEAPRRLDPDAAARQAARARSGQPTPIATPESPVAAQSPAVIDTRRYRWAIGALGITLIVVLSVVEFAVKGVGTAGVVAGQALHTFSAPLATSDLRGDANVANPSCDARRHDPRALNACLVYSRTPLVLTLFVPGAGTCVRQVNVLQELAHRYPTSSVTFAAVAVSAKQAETRKLVRTHAWTIPVAYDRDGALGQRYGVAVCPLIELVHRGGVVAERLIGEHWLSASALAPHVDRLLAGAR